MRQFGCQLQRLLQLIQLLGTDMTPHRLLNWLLATAIVAIIVGMQACDGASDVDTMRLSASDLADAQKQAKEAARAESARQYRRDMAAAALCREEFGEASFTWTQRGELVCVPRRGNNKFAKNQPKEPTT